MDSEKAAVECIVRHLCSAVQCITTETPIYPRVTILDSSNEYGQYQFVTTKKEGIAQSKEELRQQLQDCVNTCQWPTPQLRTPTERYTTCGQYPFPLHIPLSQFPSSFFTARPAKHCV